ncbi:hypothetical protein ABIF29_008831 [Bradyrhizobium elkanii]|uniref:Uncharacterized protein n=1 Tax=Bradyrhizobium elkanii TaxID=29448 RepID=A0ABV4FEZ3_BRAEL|nr:hypothetical protein [Bradyrhizobium elkanii]MCP1979125.1 hypothetical protein [Bradyrhizobium elkanii]MCS3886101.1 hypothetical protein [Bradyrhizobium elkanii]MCS4214876.1 hypothetical protein [Bradyrhizobium elkanii]MCW2189602.1 hypothetical protein [Bradyrhizobium elkanii]
MVAVTASYSLPYSGDESIVAARDDPRRAVIFAEIGQRPDRIDRDRNVRPRQRDQLGVFVDRLRLLARAEHQRAERREQAFPVQHAFDHRQHVVMQRHLPEQIVIGQEVVDAQRLEALERRPGRCEIVLALDSQHRRLQPLDQIRRGGALDHGVSVVADPRSVRLDVGVRQHGDLPVGAVSRLAESIAGQFEIGS